MQVAEVTSDKKLANWTRFVLTGEIVRFRQGNGKLYLMDLETEHGQVYVQCWGTAFIQLAKEQYKCGDKVSFFAWPHYWINKDGKHAMSVKTECLCSSPNLVYLKGVINSDWLKTTALENGNWQFTIKDLNGDCKVIHCNVPMDNLAMRVVNLGKGTPVEVIGIPSFEREEDGTIRLKITVEHMEVIKE
mgnify:CR=1 FL=1